MNFSVDHFDGAVFTGWFYSETSNVFYVNSNNKYLLTVVSNIKRSDLECIQLEGRLGFYIDLNGLGLNVGDRINFVTVDGINLTDYIYTYKPNFCTEIINDSVVLINVGDFNIPEKLSINIKLLNFDNLNKNIDYFYNFSCSNSVSNKIIIIPDKYSVAKENIQHERYKNIISNKNFMVFNATLSDYFVYDTHLNDNGFNKLFNKMGIKLENPNILKTYKGDLSFAEFEIENCYFYDDAKFRLNLVGDNHFLSSGKFKNAIYASPNFNSYYYDFLIVGLSSAYKMAQILSTVYNIIFIYSKIFDENFYLKKYKFKNAFFVMAERYIYSNFNK